MISSFFLTLNSRQHSIHRESADGNLLFFVSVAMNLILFSPDKTHSLFKASSRSSSVKLENSPIENSAIVSKSPSVSMLLITFPTTTVLSPEAEDSITGKSFNSGSEIKSLTVRLESLIPALR